MTLIILRGPHATDAAPRYAAIPNHAVIAWPTPGPAALRQLGLFPHPDAARLCRDYPLLAAAAAHPNHAHYWLIDTAIFIHTLHPATLFTALADSDADLIAPGFSPRGPHWEWGARMRALGQRPFGCRMPILRISARGVATLLAARRHHATLPAVASEAAWPNDEAMVATTLAAAGLVCQDINAAGPPCVTPHAFGRAVHDTAQLAATPPDGLIYYPAWDLERWADRAEAMLATPGRRLANPAGLRAPALREIGALAQGVLQNPVLADQTLVPLMLAARPQDTAAIARIFAATAGAPRLATAHPALCRLPPNHLGLVKPTDFALGDPLNLRRFPRHAALPYAYDLDAMDLLLTLHASLRGVLSQPFLYAGQRNLARIIARVPVAALPDIFGPLDQAASPVLVFSIGRTGSTLFKQLIGCATPRAFSEPDALTQLAESGRAMAALPESIRHALIFYAVAPFMTVRLPGGADGRCVIKLRSQANALAAETARALPAAKYVFMLRERRAWARSTFRAFGLTPAATVGRLRQALRALTALRDSGVDLSVIHYEDVVADPHAAVALLTGADPRADPALHARVAAAAAADSQAGHGLSRARTATARPGETEWMAAFESAWSDQPAPGI